MFSLNTDSGIAKRFVLEFDRLFSATAMTSKQWLSTPGGGFEGTVHYRSDLDFWAYIDTKPYRNRYSLWFGLGEPHWRPALEINVPITRSLGHYGQLVVDEDGAPHLAHRGGLGGGRYSVKPEVFADLIQGFTRDEILDGAHARRYFILGALTDTHMLRRLGAYIRQATKIRRLREDETKFATAVDLAGGLYTNGTALGGDYADENDAGGVYLIHRLTTFKRNHAKVQIALANELKRRSIPVFTSRLHGGIGPDLYTKDSLGQMASVYEIKIGANSQNIFTALGQLIVYSSEAPHGVGKYLVTRGMPRSRLFALALSKLEINTITYEMDGDIVTFEGIEPSI